MKITLKNYDREGGDLDVKVHAGFHRVEYPSVMQFLVEGDDGSYPIIIIEKNSGHYTTTYLPWKKSIADRVKATPDGEIFEYGYAKYRRVANEFFPPLLRDDICFLRDDDLKPPNDEQV